LDVFISQAKANYEMIATWQGDLKIIEDNYFYDETIDDLAIDKDQELSDLRRVRRRVTASSRFAVEMSECKIFSEWQPEAEYVDLDTDRIIFVNEVYSPVRSILVPNKYMHYAPEHRYNASQVLVKNPGVEGSAAFLDPPHKAKNNYWANLRDPRQYFMIGRTTLWESLSVTRDILVEKGNPMIAGEPYCSIKKIETDGATQYRYTGVYAQDPLSLESISLKNLFVLDSSVAFNLVHREEILPHNDWPHAVHDISYQKIGGIFVPKTIHLQVFDEHRRPLFESNISFTKSVLNERIPEKPFSIENLGLENGVRFIDRIKGVEYNYHDGKLFHASLLSEDDEQEILEEINRNDNQPKKGENGTSIQVNQSDAEADAKPVVGSNRVEVISHVSVRGNQRRVLALSLFAAVAVVCVLGIVIWTRSSRRTIGDR
jgi:hypothetical protein